MRTLLLPFAAALLISLAPLDAGAGSASAAGAEKFVQEFGNRAIDSLTVDGLSNKQLQDRFGVLFDDGFDVKAIAQFVLGRHWRRATDAEREQFIGLFNKFVIQTYANRFRKYSGEAFEVEGANPSANGEFRVTSIVVQPDGKPPVRLNWRVAPVNDGFKIYDITVEGVSMAITQRSEFASVIQRGGGKVEALLTALKDKTSQLASKEDQPVN